MVINNLYTRQINIYKRQKPSLIVKRQKLIFTFATKFNNTLALYLPKLVKTIKRAIIISTYLTTLKTPTAKTSTKAYLFPTLPH